MLLAIDIGNSDVVFGINDGVIWRHQFRIESSYSKQSSDFDAQLRFLFLENNLKIADIDRSVISSVVPHLTAPINEMVINLFGTEPIITGPAIYPKLPLEILRPQEIGTDLVCNALYAFSKYKNNCIVVDFGTALTFTTVSKTGKILGVSIAPGLNTAVKSLFSNTAQLPEVPLIVPESVIGQNTVHAIQAGVMWGYIGMVEKMLEKIKEEIGEKCIVIATGGLSSKLTQLHPFFDEVDVNITLNGLKIISELSDT
ncbi:MAG: type III pantothenate kinase [Bacteroidota bacterium]